MCTDFCGYHFAFRDNGVAVKYAFIGSPARCPASCAEQWDSSPNNNPEADGMASVFAHELSETVTDPEVNAWFRTSNNMENGDLCAWQFGTEYTASNGSRANVRLGARDYLLQENYIQGKNVCGLSYSPFARDRVSLTPLHRAGQ
jgi:hypothetical protein